MDVLECKVCFENYETVCRKPRSFGCGHTYCSVCIEDMLTKGIENCPGCRQPHKATTITNLPVNYSIMDLLVHVEQSGAEISTANFSETLAKAPQTTAGVCDDHGNHMLFYCTTCSKWICRDCTIIEHQDSKGHSVITIKAALAKKKHEGIKEISSAESHREKHSASLKEYMEELKTETVMLERLNEHVKKAMKFSLEEQDRTKQIMAEGEHLQLQVSTTKQQLTEALIYDDVSGAISRASNCQDDFTKWTTNSSSLLMTLDNRNNFLKWLMMMTCMSESINGETSSAVYFVEEVKGGSRFAALTLHMGRLHLHSLTDTPPPSDAIVLPYSRVQELIDVSGALPFLKLAWSSDQKGYVYVRLGEYSRRAHNFLLLCTGEQGPTYAGSHLIQVHWIGRCGEYIECGDYEKKDGTGGAPLLEGLEYDGKLKQLIVCGTVAAKNRGTTNASMFKIYTRDSPGYLDKGVFGCIETGMDVLRKALCEKNINDVMVLDCGVVIST